jgi:hypothetical protein
VVAVHEEPFDMPPVRGLVVRKHGTPHPSDLLKLLYKAAVSKVAAYRDAVNTLVDAMLEDADLTPGALERALEARGMDTGRLGDLWDEAERIVAEQAGWSDGFSEG